MLNPDIFFDKEKIRVLLQQPVVIIKDALQSDVAEILYQQLLETDVWEKQGTDEFKSKEYRSDFSFSRDYIDLDNPNAPPALAALYEYLTSAEIRSLFAEASGNQCDHFRGTATIFNKGDHISEHNDLFIYEEIGKPKYKRVLTFNYYLSKNWDSAWGGNLVWKKPRQVINPSFNTLVLFNVTTNSEHQVDPVLMDPETKRLSITGWFLEEMKKENFKLSL
jgi:Rps23 Pro-64 3,4-dihydroxylase Tpa1-like proline 4-hydroxylase